MAPLDDDLDQVWKALANSDRRRILDLLREYERRGEGGMATGEMVMCFPGLSRFAVMQHLQVLEKANLVVTHRQGRMVFNHLNAVPIRAIYERWVSEFEGSWAGGLLNLKRELEDGDRSGAQTRGSKRGDSRRISELRPGKSQEARRG